MQLSFHLVVSGWQVFEIIGSMRGKIELNKLVQGVNNLVQGVHRLAYFILH
jgi:hypothetical protein